MSWDNDSERALKKRFRWKRVEAPVTWRPRDGEELVGYYGGRTIRTGAYGQYEVVLVHVPERGSLLVSGSGLIALLDAGQVGIGHPVRVVFRGRVQTASGKEFKAFELYKTDGGALAPEDLPRFGDYAQ